LLTTPRSWRDVDEDLVLVDPDDLTLDDVAVLEALDVRVLLREQLLHRGRLRAEVTRRHGGRLVVRGGASAVSSVDSVPLSEAIAAGASARVSVCRRRRQAPPAVAAGSSAAVAAGSSGQLRRAPRGL
jgi:NADPH:quinone reductase-like Zn-dependent oxidoreductase